MLTLLTQVAVAVSALAFGCTALFVARRRNHFSEAQRAAWLLVGLGFTLGGVSSVLQNIGAVWAYMEGPDSAAWAMFLRWAPGGNYGRTLLRVGMACMLVAIPFVRPRFTSRWWAAIVTVYLGVILLGGIAGWAEGPLQRGIHYPNMATLETVEVVTLLSAAFVGLMWHSMDRLLWVAVLIYTFRQVLNVLSWSSLAWLDVPGAWAIPTYYIHLYGVVGYGLMLLCAWRRLYWAKRDVRVPGLLEALGTARGMSIG